MLKMGEGISVFERNKPQEKYQAMDIFKIK